MAVIFWLVVLSGHGVMAFASYLFPSIFRCSPWMIISPSWEQSIYSMTKDCRVRCLMKTYTSFRFSWKSIDQDSEEIHPRKFQMGFKWICSFISRYLPRAVFLTTNRKWIVSDHIFCEDFIVNKTALVWDKHEGTLQIKQTNSRRLKL